jgi:hypothetical protein
METEITKETFTYLGKRLSEMTESEKDDCLIYLAKEWKKYQDLYFLELRKFSTG